MTAIITLLKRKYIVVVLLLAWMTWSLYLQFRADSFLGSNGEYPLAITQNGTYIGVRNHHFLQDMFLGMPYALPPTGDLRFSIPHSNNVSWDGWKKAQAYGPHCLSYGKNREKFTQSEDCLTINVVRPHVKGVQRLPVAVYLYGGGTTGGGSGDPRYNLSFIVSKSTAMGKPFVAVSLNYRSSVWGFVSGNDVNRTGNSNLGLRDQHFALQWIQLNIEGFQGDPSQVTIWGGSSGASDVGIHLIAHGGRDDGLFRAAIMQSGSPLVETSLRNLSPQQAYIQLIRRANCFGVKDTLQCLRNIPFNELDHLIDIISRDDPLTLDALSMPTLDGDIIRAFPSRQLQTASLIRVPIIIGTTTNEGSTFAPGGLEGPGRLERYLAGAWQLPDEIVQKLLSLYPLSNNGTESSDFVAGLHDDIFFQAAALIGDLELISSHRLTCETFARYASCFSFRFDAVPSGGDTDLGPAAGVTHGAEIGPVFQNIEGVGFLRNPFLDQSLAYFMMADLIGVMWINFITTLDPNGPSKAETAIRWPAYDLERPQNIVFSDSVPSFTELDTARSEAIQYINQINGVVGR
ncbi:carboxylesterase [Penicillium verrucosum]|uniref:carboxylesterase n=1 Tax=Penicillium verrucosum TaxID=60171 RepID=UPI0025454C8B|nr:carboxylesterase [Penicillium verrucosum]KAJ5927345.1 carboxylesterase [Penicillium verrucosum]